MAESSILAELGWSSHWEALFDPHLAAGLVPARVVRVDRGSALVAALSGVVRAKPSVRLLKATAGPADLPVVGDWVGALISDDLDVSLIEAVLARKNAITRGDPGNSSDMQVLAANIDTVFIVHPIAERPNLSRVERELSLAWESGAAPVVVLTKADLSSDPDTALAAVESIAIGVDVLLMNALDGESAQQLVGYISNQRTAVLFGPSGAGKSTIINSLLGEQKQTTHDVRVGDGKGRHTTVARELVRIRDAGSIIDTPGLRALGLTGSEEGIAATFPDIERIAVSCRFHDCVHNDEPGCAVKSAIASGDLPSQRLTSYHKLLREAEVVAAKTDAHRRAEEKRKSRTLAKTIRRSQKKRGGRSRDGR